MLKDVQKDDVSNIHRRWSFTRLSPSSFRASFSGSLICGLVLIAISHFYYIGSDATTAVIYTTLGTAVLAGLHFVDHLALRGTPVKKLSKVGHVALFANLIWLFTAALGIASDSLFSKTLHDLDYLVAGMFLAAGLRVGIFVSVFGASLTRAILISFIMPASFLFAFLPGSAYPLVFSAYSGAAFGLALYLLGVLWVTVTDRAGRPLVKSTFAVLQAFLSAWTENDSSKIEQYIDSRAHEEQVSTSVLKFNNANDGTFVSAIVLPDVHPGPFGTVGGSNLPFVLYRMFSNRALVMHSVSDHSLNIPSKAEVDRYVQSVSAVPTLWSGETCTHPVRVTRGKATATGMAFGRTAMVMLSLAPHGMEDVPQSVRAELESHSAGAGFSGILVVDCHNAMGKHLEESDRAELTAAARECIDLLAAAPQYKFKVGFSGTEDAVLAPGELGESGIAVMAIAVEDKIHAIGWSDSNNMANQMREEIISAAGGEISIVEVCTSDTHSTSGKRTREGYFPLGTTADRSSIASAFHAAAAGAADGAHDYCTFEFARADSQVRVMGDKQFKDYSSALDSSMSVTKVFLGVTAATYIAMLVLS